MKAGDIIEWEGLNGIIRGEVVECAATHYGYLVRLDNGCAFSLDDLRLSHSAKLIRK